MPSDSWKQHTILPSLIGQQDNVRPTWPGDSGSLLERHCYMRNYLQWALGITEECMRDIRPIAERMTAKVYAERGVEQIGRHRWDHMVDSTLWNLAFAHLDLRGKDVPMIPWKEPSDTLGGPSCDYQRLKNNHRAQAQNTSLAPRQLDAHAEAQPEEMTALEPKTQAGQTPDLSAGKASGALAGDATSGDLQQNKTLTGSNENKGPTNRNQTVLPLKRKLVEVKTPPPLGSSMTRNSKPPFADKDDEPLRSPPSAKRLKSFADAPKKLSEAETNVSSVAKPEEQDQRRLLQHQGTLYIDSPEAPSLESRQALYDTSCVTVEGRQNPFEIVLPQNFDFKTLLWGKDGGDWDLIQKEYVPANVKLTWGYKGGIPEDATIFMGSIDESRLANVGYVLTVGRVDEEDNRYDDSVLTTWKVVRLWWDGCHACRPKPLKLVFFDWALDAERRAQGPLPTLKAEYKVLEEMLNEDRNLCDAQIGDILREGGEQLGENLEFWLTVTSAGSRLSTVERIEMVSFSWYHQLRTEKECRLGKKWRLDMLDKHRNLD